jgi:hypothetical protein
MQHPILRQQHGAHIQQFVEDLNIGYARMLGCQKYKLDRPLTQALAELPHQWGFLANAFVDNNPFYAEHEWTRGSLQRRSVVHCATLAVLLHRCFRRHDTASLAAFTGRALMIFRAGFALNTVGSFVNGLTPLRAFVTGFLITTNLANPGTKKAPVFLSSL